MPAVVVSAAVGGRENARVSTLEPILVNPFKRRQKALDAPITERSKTLGPERSTEEPSDEGYCAAGECSGQDEVRDGELNPVSSEALPQSHPSASSENQLNEEHERENTYVDEQFFLTRTPYPYLVREFSLVPITSFLTVFALILLMYGIWTPVKSSSITLYLGLFIFSAATWIASFALRIPLYLISSFACRITPAFTPPFSTLVQVVCEEALRLSVIVLSQLRLREKPSPSDPTFSCIWMLAMGWASAEVATSIWQGYEQLAQYKDVLLPAHDATVFPERAVPDTWTLDETARVESDDLHEDPEGHMNKQIDRFLRVRARLELEELYGIPVPNIPVFISSLQRIDSIILSLALFLLMSSSYLQNALRQDVPEDPSHYAQTILGMIPVFSIITALHTFLSLMWSVSILPWIGVHTASYLGLLFALGALFAGLGQWDAL